MSAGTRLADCSRLLAAQLLVFLAALEVGPMLGYLARLTPAVYEFPLALTAVAVLTCAWEKKPGVRVWSVAIFSVLILVSVTLSRHLHALNSDGQTYHAEAIRLLLRGWNPIWGPTPADLENVSHIVPFSKGPWLIAAAFIRLTGDVEAGTAADLLLLAAVAALAIHIALRQGLSPRRAFLVGAVVAANPVAVNQLWSYYVDGQLASLFTLAVLISYQLVRQRDTELRVLIPVVLILLVNVKLSGSIYALLLGLTLLAAVPERRLLVHGTSSFLAAFCLAGFSPYMTNIVRYHNPIYPLHQFASPNRKDPVRALQLRHQTPVGLQPLGRLSMLFHSLGGRCDNRWDAAYRRFLGGELKIPGTVCRAELASFMQVDTRVAGWGPLSGLVMLVSLLVLPTAPRPRRSTLILLAGTACSVLIVPDLWWARFVPQVWMFPTALTVALIAGRRDRSAAVMLALLALNIAGVFGPYLYRQITGSARLRMQLAQLASSPGPVQVSWGGYHLNRLRFEQWKIAYQSVAQLPPGTLMLEGQDLIAFTRVGGLTIPPLGNHPHATSEAELAQLPRVQEPSTRASRK